MSVFGTSDTRKNNMKFGTFNTHKTLYNWIIYNRIQYTMFQVPQWLYIILQSVYLVHMMLL